MLDTLLKIGEWQGEKFSKWDRILDKPKVRWESRGKSVTQYIVTLFLIWGCISDLKKEYDELNGRSYRFSNL